MDIGIAECFTNLPINLNPFFLVFGWTLSQGASTSNPQPKRINGMVIGSPQKKQSVKRPDHIDSRDPTRNNPLSKKGGSNIAKGGGGGTQDGVAQSPERKKVSKV